MSGRIVRVPRLWTTEIARRFPVQSIPTLLFMREGKEVARLIGALPDAALRRWVQRGLPQP